MTDTYLVRGREKWQGNPRHMKLASLQVSPQQWWWKMLVAGEGTLALRARPALRMALNTFSTISLERDSSYFQN